MQNVGLSAGFQSRPDDSTSLDGVDMEALPARQIEVFFDTSSNTVWKTAGQTEAPASVLIYM